VFLDKGYIDPDDEEDKINLEKTNFPVVKLTVNLLRDPREILTSIYTPAIIFALYSAKTTLEESVNARMYNVATSILGILGL